MLWLTPFAFLVIFTSAALFSETSAADQAPADCKRTALPSTFDIFGPDVKKFSNDEMELKFIHTEQFHLPLEGAGEAVWLSLKGGASFPIHGHPPGSFETIFVTGGTGIHEILLPGKSEPEQFDLHKGVVALIPVGSVHTVRNTDEKNPLEMLVTTNLKFTPIHVFEKWPSSTNEKGVEVPVMPWEAACPPGHELEKEEL